MEYAYMLSGGAPLKMGFQINETLATAGIPVLAPGGNNAGVQISVVTSWANAVGVTLDTATYVTAQQTDGTSAEREVDVIISPTAVFRVLMSGSSTENTDLPLFTVTSISTDGLTITTGDDFTGAPSFDESVIWGYSGANVGQKRKITATGVTAATVTVPFDFDTVVGDEFMRAPYWFLDDTGNNVQTTTLLTQADTTITVGTGGDARIIDMELRDIGGEGRSHSFVLFVFDDHALREAT